MISERKACEYVGRHVNLITKGGKCLEHLTGIYIERIVGARIEYKKNPLDSETLGIGRFDVLVIQKVNADSEVR